MKREAIKERRTRVSSDFNITQLAVKNSLAEMTFMMRSVAARAAETRGARSVSEAWWPVGSVARSRRWVMMSVVLPPSPTSGCSSRSDGAKDVLTYKTSACMRRFNVADVDEACSPSLQYDLNNSGEDKPRGVQYSPRVIQKCRFRIAGCKELGSKP